MSMFYELTMRKKGIPERYQEVEYIQSDGNAYIDTGLILDSNFEIEVDFISNETSADKPVFSSRVSSGNNEITFFTSDTKFQLKYGNSNVYVSGYSNNTKYNIKTNGQNWYIDGNLVQTFANTTTLTQPLYISAVKNEGATSPNFVGKHKFQLFKVKKNGSLIRNYIPVYDTLTNKYGMWESVQGKFYGNNGTGDFKGSIVGYTVVGSPTITDGVLTNTSSSNFIRTTSDIPEYSSLEAEVVTTISSATSSFQSIFALTGNYAMVFEYRNAIAVRYRIYNDSATEVYDGTYSIVANQPITINLKINGTNAVITIIQNDTIKLQKSYSITRITNSSKFQLGYFWQGLTTGSVDLNKTFVKLDNKLWFNGQPS